MDDITVYIRTRGAPCFIIFADVRDFIVAKSIGKHDLVNGWGKYLVKHSNGWFVPSYFSYSLPHFEIVDNRSS